MATVAVGGPLQLAVRLHAPEVPVPVIPVPTAVEELAPPVLLVSVAEKPVTAAAFGFAVNETVTFVYPVFTLIGKLPAVPVGVPHVIVPLPFSLGSVC